MPTSRRVQAALVAIVLFVAGFFTGRVNCYAVHANNQSLVAALRKAEMTNRSLLQMAQELFANNQSLLTELKRSNDTNKAQARKRQE